VITSGEPSDAVIAASGGAIATSLLGNSLFTTEEDEQPEPSILLNDTSEDAVLHSVSSREAEEQPLSEPLSFVDDDGAETSQTTEALDALFGLLG
jgi:hypothetical protein